MKDGAEAIVNRLEEFRALMRRQGVQAAIIPQTDPHLGEYIASHWQVRRFLSGFTGSAGTLVVTLDGAYLWVDSRYFLQGERQIEGTGIRLIKEGLPDSPTIAQWLCAHLVKGDTVGIDGMLFSQAETQTLRDTLEKHSLELDTRFDVIDEVWKDRPALPRCEVFVHAEELAGQSARDKMDQVLDQVMQQGAGAILVSDLAEIAWTLNIRSRDVHYNPVATAFLYLSSSVDDEGQTTLFIDPAKITPQVAEYLKALDVRVETYAQVVDGLEGLPEGARVLVDGSHTASLLVETLGGRVVVGTSPIPMLKAAKNSVQIQGMKLAMEKDGVALVKAFREFERRMAQGERLTEIDVAGILTRFRSEQDDYFDDSFETIAGYGPHGAIVHYAATEETDVEIHPDGLLLIDSGAQYLHGTTDITRTVCLGTPTAEQRHDFTLVLKGNIALAMAVFPEGTYGTQLDVLARQYLWREGKAYLHGTGHGVGHFLNVHEGPHQFRLNYMPAPLMPGLVISDEPGLYVAGSHGVRCENLLLTLPAMTTEFGAFYRFETITLFPFDLGLVEMSMMTPAEIDWLNGYHREVYSRLSPRLTPDEGAWLAEKTRELR